MVKLSVVIVNYNVKYFLEQALLSVIKAERHLRETHPDWETETWVVDNNSVDGSVEMVRNRFPEVKLIANTKNIGFSVANNQAIKESKGEYVLLLNPDTVVQEDTFLKTIEFMDAHPNGGGLGVKMLDGKGEFLPESKRGFPSPAVAFFKIFGLSKLFPKSKIFGRYHLGFLDDNETHEVDVLAGAFMLLRRSVLDKIGLLDETFFMYGEDIDLSYRIVKAGYKNYYFPHTRIIHYKGESTKKSSVNYVFVFYKAMVIFAKKHFSRQHAFLFSTLLYFAIYLRAGVSVIIRILKKLFLPVLDAAILYGVMYLLVRYWERMIKYIEGGEYNPILLKFFVPLYILIWLAALFVSRAYQKPYKIRRVIRGVLTGTLLILVLYALLPEHYRFSRAIIILGAGLATFVFSLNRLVLKVIRKKSLLLEEDTAKKVVIVGNKAEAERVVGLLDKSRLNYTLIGVVNPSQEVAYNADFIGNINQLDEIAVIYKVDEIIFCAKDLASETIISWMSRISNPGIDFKIVPEESLFVIGSNSKDRPGDYYSYEIELAISRKENRFNKRLFDAGSALLLLITLPLNFWFVKNKSQYISNIFSVILGNKTWVSYSFPTNSIMKLPKLKPGVLTPVAELNYNNLDASTKMRLDYLYAKDYSIYSDVAIFFNGFRNLGS